MAAADVDAGVGAMVDAVRQAVETTLQKELTSWRQHQQAQQEQMLLELRSLWLSTTSGERGERSTTDLPGTLPEPLVEMGEGTVSKGRQWLPPVPREAPQVMDEALVPVLLMAKAETGHRNSRTGSLASLTPSPRGMLLKELMRTTQTTILQSDVCISDEILYHQIGVDLFTGAGKAVGGLICFLFLLQPTFMGVIHMYGHVHPTSYVWTTITTWFFSLEAILSIHFIRRAVHSDDLHRALTKLDLFVRDVGCGLDWSTMAHRERYRAIALWILLAILFLGLQVVEQRDIDMGLYDHEVLETERASLPLARQLSHVTAALNSITFLLSSAVVVKGAWVQCNLLAGLSKTLDCWCGDMFDTPDFGAGVGTWNEIQALLKSVGRALGPCFLSLQILGNVGLITALAGAFSVLLFSDAEVHTVVSSTIAMLPLVVLFAISARLLGEGGSLTKKCEDVPAFVNQLGSGVCDAGRQYLVHFINNSRTGFIVAGVTLTNSLFLKQMATLATFMSSLTGVLLRRYL